LGALLIDRLRDAQALPDSPLDSEGYAYVQSLFDALIQLRASVPAAVMMPFEKFWRAEILIAMNGAGTSSDFLLYRRTLSPDSEGALIEMREHQMRGDEEAEWAALNDLLFALDPKVGVEKALRDIRMTHEFCVSDQNALRADDGSGGVGTSIRHFPKGFPPIALYQIRTHANPGDQVFLDQPIAAYYARVVVPTDGEVKWSTFEFHGASTSARQRTLEGLLEWLETPAKHQQGEIFHPWTAVDWQGTEGTRAAIESLLDRQEAAIRAVVQEIGRRGFLKTTGMRFAVNVIVRDCRRGGRDSLPQIAPVREIAFP
jgi:hypothetical protein